MPPIPAEVPTFELAPAAPSQKHKSENMEAEKNVGGEPEVLYRLVDLSVLANKAADSDKIQPSVVVVHRPNSDTKAAEKQSILPQSPNSSVSDRLKGLIRAVPQSEMPARILRMRHDGKCVACGAPAIDKGPTSFLIRHRLFNCPGTGSGDRTKDLSADQYSSAARCLACDGKLPGSTLYDLTYHKLYNGCKSGTKEEFDLFKSLVFADADFPAGLEMDLSPVETEFADKISEENWVVPPSVYRAISKHLSSTKSNKDGTCIDCDGHVSRDKARSIFAHRLSSCPSTDSGKRALNFFLCNYTRADGACLACQESCGLNTPRYLLHHKLINGCKRATLKELIYLMSLVFKNSEEITATLKEGLDGIDVVAAESHIAEPAIDESMRFRIRNVPRIAEKTSRHGKAKAAGQLAALAEQDSEESDEGAKPPACAEDMKRRIGALFDEGQCKACGESIELKSTAFVRRGRAIIAHKLHSCAAMDSAKTIAGKPLSLFVVDKKCSHCMKNGYFASWRDMVYHKIVDGCSKDEEERKFFYSLVFSGKEPESARSTKDHVSSSVRPEGLLPPSPAVDLDPEAIYLSRSVDADEEVCRACKGISCPGDRLDWNKTWIGCTECGEAYHRSCALPKPSPLCNVTILPRPCNPLKLTAETHWTCPSCLVCDKCSTASNVLQCSQCHRKKCHKCSPARAGMLWTGQYYVCSDCKPACISCAKALPEARAQESLMCRRCQVNWANGLHCPTCLAAYSEEEEEDFPMIQCEACSVWVHFPCTGLSTAELRRFEGEGCKSVYKCPRCEPLRVDTTPQPCSACREPGAHQSVAPGILAHQQCASLAKHLFSTVQQRGPFVERKGVRSVGLGAVQLRTWDIRPSVAGPPRSRHTWTLTRAEQEGGALCALVSDGVSKHAFEGAILEELYGDLRGLLAKQSVRKHRIDRILGLLEEGAKRLAQLSVPAKRGPEPTIAIDPEEEQPTKRLRRKKKNPGSTEALPPVPTSFLGACSEDPLSCARTRGHSTKAPKPATVPSGASASASRDEPEPAALDSFNANFVPVRSDRLGHYRTATLPMAYRLMGSRQIEKGDLTVARSGIAGYGLFAGRKYIPNELVIEYQGEIIGQALADWRESRLPAYRQSCYMFRLDDARIIDATVIGNAARFINHCCQPNCRTKPVVIEGQPRILIIAKKEIAPGEELSYDYQFALDEDDGKGRLPCYCGARKCRGWMN